MFAYFIIVVNIDDVDFEKYYEWLKNSPYTNIKLSKHMLELITDTYILSVINANDDLGKINEQMVDAILELDLVEKVGDEIIIQSE
jgi:hypothetical protein